MTKMGEHGQSEVEKALLLSAALSAKISPASGKDRVGGRWRALRTFFLRHSLLGSQERQ